MGYRKIDEGIKNQILDKIKQGNAPVEELAKEYQIKVRTIYGWLSKNSGDGPSLLEFGKLKKENKILAELVGRLSVKLNTGKKRSWPKNF